MGFRANIRRVGIANPTASIRDRQLFVKILQFFFRILFKNLGTVTGD